MLDGMFKHKQIVIVVFRVQMNSMGGTNMSFSIMYMYFEGKF